MTDSQLNQQATYSVDEKNRLRDIAGQISAVLSMMDQKRNCADVIPPLAAIHSSVDYLILHIVGASMTQCIRTELRTGDSAEDMIRENIHILMKSR